MSDKHGLPTVDELVTDVYENWPSAIRNYPPSQIRTWAASLIDKYKTQRGLHRVKPETV